MQYKKLGSTGLEVSNICLGTMSFGRWIDEKSSVAILNEAIESGINFIDTANYYGKGQDETPEYGTGEAEEIIGRAIRWRRDEVILATKVGLPMGYGKNSAGLSRVHIMREVERSLQRLQTDYIDLYQVHFFDPNTPLEETLRALDDLVRQGKVRYIGCSNFAAWQIAKAHSISERMNLEKFVSVQPQYSLLVRDVENELIPFCESEEVGMVVYSPMARGMLSGKYNGPEDVPDDSRAAHGEKRLFKLFSERNFELVEQYKDLANRVEITLSQFALSWVLNQRVVTSAIIGATKVSHVTDAVEVSDLQLPEELLCEIDKGLKGVLTPL
ncbi:aldo/keto reductase [Anaerobacillus arseniciselenatis]|uniref:Aldo/keto reductase n=1 Tax=Anaerobacillus arseniciselenatis TaxID=85682 RepID=A0A1S2LR10_9BACI|nr:aldo/keto reductase [Anaerobacillus arseniciselenatis]OIJ14553.1 aldo/keto reductase [Anaerobacillus arseniciselenatis]